MLDTYIIALTDPPLKHNSKPVLTTYAVTAESPDEALSLFKAEVEWKIREDTAVKVLACNTRLMRSA